MPLTSKLIPETKVVSVGQLRLKRTLITDPRIVRLYLTEQMYFKLNTLSHHAQYTPDELIRFILQEYIKENE